MEIERPNNFVRVLIIFLVIALCSLCFFNFFWRNPPFEISAGLLALIALIVLLSLSEVFDQLTFGTILSLQRKVSEAKASNESLREENGGLRSQLIALVASVQQSQVNNTFNVPTEAWAKALGVVPSQKTSTDDEVDTQGSASIAGQAEPPGTIAQLPGDRFKRQRAAQSVAVRRYLDSMQVPQSERLLNVEFSASFQNIDPVMDRRIVFDAYVRAPARERFIEAVRGRAPSFVHADRIYVMLTKIWLYRQAKKVQAELILLLVEVENEDSDEKPRSSNRLIEYFQPAITNDILRIERVRITDEEIDRELSSDQSALPE